MTFITFSNTKYSFSMGIDYEMTRLRVYVGIINNTGLFVVLLPIVTIPFCNII